MKKIFCLVVIIMCFMLVGCGKSQGTIEELTGVKFDEISYIKTGGASEQNENYDVDKFISEYKNLKYKKISGKYGNTSHVYYVCYDDNDKVLFTLVDVGNQDKVFIKKGKFNINKDASSSLYQLDK